MIKRIAMSLGAIIFVAAAAYGATGAFFNDTETSSGNTFSAGAIDLTVDSTSHYAGLICALTPAVDNATAYTWQDDPADATATTRPDLLNTACSGTWTATDLGASNQFFNFGDVKPGDPGEDTVSLHINNNDAWACMDITTTANNENTAIEPELSDGDTAANGPADGELAQNLSFTTWLDNASTSNATPGDNIHQAGETILSGPITAASLLGATTSLPLADSTTGTGPMIGGATSYVGIAWCVGTQTVNPTTGVISCDGATVPNTVQTDSATSTVSFRVEQARNNASFTCGATTTPPTEEIDVTDNALNGWQKYNDEFGNPASTTFAADADAPAGSNALRLETGSDNNTRVGLFNSTFSLPLSGAVLSYESKQVSAADITNGNATMRIWIDTNNDGTADDQLMYEPYYNGFNGNTMTGWQTWTVSNSVGQLWSNNTLTYNGKGGVSAGSYASNFTLADVLTTYPAAKIVGISFSMGTFNPNQVVLVDNFKMNGTTYDFGN